jgi:hypothetical protein
MNEKLKIGEMIISDWFNDRDLGPRKFRCILSKGTGSIEIFRHWNPPEDIDISFYGDLNFLEPFFQKQVFTTFDAAQKKIDEILERFAKLGSFQ